MTILALDIGGSLGWAHLLPDRLEHGSEDLVPNCFDGAGMRFVRLRRFLDQRHEKAPLSLLVFEEVRNHGSKDKNGRARTNVRAAQIFGGYIAIAMSWCEDNNVPHTSASIGVWKKAITGQGGASKELVKAHVSAMGYETQNHDESDAVAIAIWAEQEWGKTIR